MTKAGIFNTDLMNFPRTEDAINFAKAQVSNGKQVMFQDGHADENVREWFKDFEFLKLSKNLWLIGYNNWKNENEI